METATPSRPAPLSPSVPLAFADRPETRAGLRPASLETLQVNIGKRCNQACRHCHVEASPARTESMGREGIDRCLAILASHPGIKTLDVTGGAPELHPDFRYFVSEARKLGKHVIDRCNLTLLEEPGHEDLAAFLAGQQVEIIASMPCYTEENVDRQRGQGVFAKSIAALRRLNAFGYGTALPLNLIYNPGGIALPGPQAGLERDYKERLGKDHGIVFNRLYVMTNMPIGRFREDLARGGKLGEYMDRLESAFNPGIVGGLMCRSQISVGWDGRLYDCDFNQMLELDAEPIGHLRDFDASALLERRIRLGNHCYGCTAGAGSSCGGELAPKG
jgi:radical SAM/Cys-rich protein